MATKNFNRQNEDIARMLATLIRNVKDPRVNQGMLSITAVETSGDLRYSNVYLSVLGLKSEKELMKGLKSASGYLRHELGNALELRYTPELIFHLDKSIEHGAMINEILSGLEAKTDKSAADEKEDEDTDEQS